MKLWLVYILSIVFFVSCSERQAYLIDDVVSSKEKFERLDTSEIFSIRKSDPNSYTTCFPDHEKMVPVVIVTTKKAEEEKQRQRHALLNAVLNLATYQKDLLIIKDGLIYPQSEMQSLRNLSSDQLSGALIMSEEDARSLYGSQARSITLVINTYRAEGHSSTKVSK